MFKISVDCMGGDNGLSVTLPAALNFLKAASLAEKDFIWFIGDDDLLVPNAIENLLQLIDKNPECDFFWVNSYHLD